MGVYWSLQLTSANEIKVLKSKKSMDVCIWSGELRVRPSDLQASFDTIRWRRIDMYSWDWKHQGPICCRCGTSLYCCWPCPL